MADAISMRVSSSVRMCTLPVPGCRCCSGAWPCSPACATDANTLSGCATWNTLFLSAVDMLPRSQYSMTSMWHVLSSMLARYLYALDCTTVWCVCFMLCCSSSRTSTSVRHVYACTMLGCDSEPRMAISCAFFITIFSFLPSSHTTLMPTTRPRHRPRNTLAKPPSPSRLVTCRSPRLLFPAKSMELLMRFWLSFSVRPVTSAPVEERDCVKMNESPDIDMLMPPPMLSPAERVVARRARSGAALGPQRLRGLHDLVLGDQRVGQHHQQVRRHDLAQLAQARRDVREVGLYARHAEDDAKDVLLDLEWEHEHAGGRLDEARVEDVDRHVARLVDELLHVGDHDLLPVVHRDLHHRALHGHHRAHDAALRLHLLEQLEGGGAGCLVAERALHQRRRHLGQVVKDGGCCVAAGCEGHPVPDVVVVGVAQDAAHVLHHLVHEPVHLCCLVQVLD
mmetsp:Transcript_14217/g.35115  ORF Transcript_14217/g.35115 Transcript_14217/m.35115 type:complete len:451 (+) Transcript_14217:118-1470(+)